MTLVRGIKELWLLEVHPLPLGVIMLCLCIRLKLCRFKKDINREAIAAKEGNICPRVEEEWHMGKYGYKMKHLKASHFDLGDWTTFA